MKVKVNMLMVEQLALSHESELDICMECAFFGECDEMMHRMCPILELHREDVENEVCYQK